MQQNICLKDCHSAKEGFKTLCQGVRMCSRLRHWAILWLALVLVALQGCVIFSTPEHGLLSGRGEISEADVAFLEVGKTTREEVLLHFGEPSVRLNNEGFFINYAEGFIYNWKVVRGYWALGSAGGSIEKAYQVVLEFDEQGLLARYERTAPGLFSASGEPFSATYPRLPEGKSAIYVYRPKEFLTAGSEIPITIDGKHLTDLQCGSFSVAIINPGSHEVSYPDYHLIHGTFYRMPRTQTIRLELKPEEKVFVRLRAEWNWLSGMWPGDLEVIAEKEALQEISETYRSVVYSPHRGASR